MKVRHRPSGNPQLKRHRLIVLFIAVISLSACSGGGGGGPDGGAGTSGESASGAGRDDIAQQEAAALEEAGQDPAGGTATPDGAPAGGDQSGICQTAHSTGVPHSHGDGLGGCRPGTVTPDGGGPDTANEPPTGGGTATGGSDQGGICQTAHSTGVPHSHGDGLGGCRPGTVTSDGGGPDTANQPPAGGETPTAGGDQGGICQTAHSTPVPHSHGNGHGGCIPGEVSETGRVIHIENALLCEGGSISLIHPQQELIIDGNGESCIAALGACAARIEAATITLRGCRSCVVSDAGSSVSLSAANGEIICDASGAAFRAANRSAIQTASRVLSWSRPQSGGAENDAVNDIVAEMDSLVSLNVEESCNFPSTENILVESRAGALVEVTGCGPF